MKKRGHRKAERARRHERERDATADNKRSDHIFAPDPNDENDDNAAGYSQGNCRCHFAAKRTRKPTAGNGRRTQCVDRDAHRLHADALVESEHHRQKKRQNQTPRERRFKKPSQNCRDGAAGHRDKQPRKTKPENAPRRSASNLLNVKPECLEKLGTHRRRGAISILTFAGLQNFLREQIRIDDSDDAASFVNHGKGEKFVEHEELASIQNGGRRGNSDNAWNHHVPQ